jgi:hypothetical protein
MAINVGEIRGTLEIKDNSSASINKVVHALDTAEKQFDEVGSAGKDAFAGIGASAKTSGGFIEEARARFAAMKAETDGLSDKITTLKGAASSSTLSIRAMLPVIGALGGLFSLAAVKDFVVGVVSTADSLTKLHDRTQIAVSGLQVLKAIGDSSGNSLDKLAESVAAFRERLAGGDTSAIAALDRLGLSIDAITRLQPEEQFHAIARGVKAIEDPAERVRVALDLFGRTGDEILPSLIADIDAITASTVAMSDRTVDAFASVGAGWTRTWTNVKNTAANAIVGVVDALAWAQAQIDKIARRANLPSSGSGSVDPGLPSIGSPPSTRGAGLPVMGVPADADEVFRRAGDELKQLTATIKDNERAAEQTAKANERFRESVRSLTSDAVGARQGMGAFGALFPASEGRGSDFQNVLKGLNADGTLVSRTLMDLEIRLQKVGQMGLGPSIKEQGKDLGKNLGASIGQAVITAVASRGNIGQAVGAVVGGAVGDTASGIVAKSVGKVAGAVGSKIGGAVGMIMGPIGSMVGSLIGGLASKAISKLMGGPSAKELEGRAASLKFQDSLNAALTTQQKLEAGGDRWKGTIIAARDAYRNVGMSAADAEKAVKALWDAEKKGPEAVAKAMEPIQAAIKKNADAQDLLNAALNRHKFTTEEMGPALERQRLDEQMKQIFSDWTVLTGAGVSVTAVIREMGGSINAFIQRAVATGTEVPNAMRPMLEKMVEAGELFDASGNKIGDLEASGISFSMTMTEGFKTVVDSVTDLTNVIKRQLGIAIEETANRINAVPDLNIDVHYNDPGFVPGPTGGEPPPVDSGGGTLVAVQGGNPYDWNAGTERRWDVSRMLGSPGTSFEDWGRGTPVTLHGNESVVTRAQGESLAAMLVSAVRPDTTSRETTVRLVHEHKWGPDGNIITTTRQFAVPIFQQVIEDNIGGARTRLQENLGVI